MGANTKYTDRPCQYFDHPTLHFVIKRNWCGLKQVALDEWKYRWGTDYPRKGKSDGTQSEATTADQG